MRIPPHEAIRARIPSERFEGLSGAHSGFEFLRAGSKAAGMVALHHSDAQSFAHRETSAIRAFAATTVL
jgi:hypothetical protein